MASIAMAPNFIEIDPSIYFSYGTKQLRQDVIDFAMHNGNILRHETMDKDQIIQKFDRLYYLTFSTTVAKGLLETPMSFTCVCSYDPHMFDAKNEITTFITRDMVMSEKVGGEYVPSVAMMNRKNKYTSNYSHSTPMSCSTNILDRVQEILNKTGDLDAYDHKIIDSFTRLFFSSFDGSVDAIKNGNIYAVSNYLKEISPSIHLVRAMENVSDSGFDWTLGSGNLEAIKNRAMNDAADEFMDKLFIGNVHSDGCMGALRQLANESNMCDDRSMILQSDAANFQTEDLGSKSALLATIKAIKDAPTDKTADVLANMNMLQTRLEDPKLRNIIKTIDDVKAVQIVGLKTFNKVAKKLKNIQIVSDRRRGIMKIDQIAEQSITQSGLMVVNYSDEQSIKKNPGLLNFIDIVRGGMDMDGSPTPTISANNSIVLANHMGYYIDENDPGSKVVLVDETASDVARRTKKPHCDPCKDTLSINRISVTGISDACDHSLKEWRGVNGSGCGGCINSVRRTGPYLQDCFITTGNCQLKVPNHCVWEDFSGRRIKVPMQTMLEDFIFNPALFNHIILTELYNNSEGRISNDDMDSDLLLQDPTSPQCVRALHNRGVWDVFPPERRHELQNIYANHEVLDARIVTDAEVATQRTYSWTPYNRKQLSYQRVTSSMSEDDYDQPGRAHLLHDQINPFMALQFTKLYTRKGTNFKAILSSAINKKLSPVEKDDDAPWALFTPIHLQENIPQSLRPPVIVRYASERLASKFYPRLMSDNRYSACLESWYTSLNPTKGQYLFQKILEYDLITSFTDNESMHQSMADHLGDVTSPAGKFMNNAILLYEKVRGQLACDCNYELTKGFAKLPLTKANYRPSLGEMKNLCTLMVEIIEMMSDFFEKALHAEFQRRGGMALMSQKEIDDLYRSIGAELFNITNILTPTECPMGCIGSNMMGQADIFESDGVSVYAFMSVKQVTSPQDQATFVDMREETDGSNPKYKRFVQVETPHKVFTTKSRRQMIEYKLFYELITQLAGNKLVAAKPNNMTTNGTTQIELTDSTDKGIYASFMQDVSKNKLDVTGGTFIVKSPPAKCLRMNAGGANDDYYVYSPCIIDGVLIKNADPIDSIKNVHPSTIEMEWSYFSKDNKSKLVMPEPASAPITIPDDIEGKSTSTRLFAEDLDTLRTANNHKLVPVPISLSVCCPDTIARAKLVTSVSEMSGVRASMSQPDLCFYSDSRSEVKREGIRYREYIYDHLHPVAMALTIPIQKAYATPTGFCALAEYADHPTIGLAVSIHDIIATESVFTVTTASVHLRQGPMQLIESTANGSSSTDVQENLRMGETKPGIPATATPHILYTGPITDAGYNPRKYYGSNLGAGTFSPYQRRVPQHTHIEYENLKKARPGSWSLESSMAGRNGNGVHFDNFYPFGGQAVQYNSIIQSETFGEKGRKAGNRMAEASTVDLLFVPASFKLNNLESHVNMRNPGKDNVFQMYANGYSRKANFTGEPNGITCPWTYLPHCVNLSNLYMHDTARQWFLTPYLAVSNSAISKSLEMMTNNIRGPTEAGMLGKNTSAKRGSDGQKTVSQNINASPKSHVNPLSLQEGFYGNLSTVIGAALRLKSVSDERVLQDDIFLKSDAVAPIKRPNGDYIVPASFNCLTHLPK